jgi:hypothetical protein
VHTQIYTSSKFLTRKIAMETTNPKGKNKEEKPPPV